MNRYFYADTIENFIKSDSNYILGSLVRNSPFDITDLQRNAWEEEINLLSSILQNEKGQIIFEYDIPRLGKRIYVIDVPWFATLVKCLYFSTKQFRQVQMGDTQHGFSLREGKRDLGCLAGKYMASVVIVYVQFDFIPAAGDCHVE